MVLTQCHGKSRAMQCRNIILIHDYLLFVCVQAFICICSTFYFSPILLSMNCHSDCRIAGNPRPHPGIFQRSIKSSRVQELCQTHFVVETKNGR